MPHWAIRSQTGRQGGARVSWNVEPGVCDRVGDNMGSWAIGSVMVVAFEALEVFEEKP